MLINHYISLRIFRIMFSILKCKGYEWFLIEILFSCTILESHISKNRMKNVGDSLKSQNVWSTPVSFYAHGWQFSFYFISGESSHENFKTVNHFAITASKYMPCGILEMDTNDKRKMGSWWEQWNILKIIQHVIQSLLKALGLLDSS